MTIGKIISKNGLDQDSLVEYLSNVLTNFNLLRTTVYNQCYGYANLGEGTNANTIKTQAAISFSIGGTMYTKAITDNIAMTACAQQAISTYCLYLASINAAGTVTLTKGTEVATDTATLPATPANNVAFGYIKVATDASHTFTSGTTDLSAAGITATYANLAFNTKSSEVSSALSLSV